MNCAALISPREFRLACSQLQAVAQPIIYSKEFQSGLVVLHTTRFTLESVTKRVVDFVSLSQGGTSLDLATVEGLSLGVTNQFLIEIEQAGSIVRDEQDSERGIVWYPNYLQQAEWDGQPT